MTVIGDPPFAVDGSGKLKVRIATVFPRDGILVTVPGVHATQRQHYVKYLNGKRAEAGSRPLSGTEEEEVWLRAVDLIIEPGVFLIRPDPANMPLSFEADELLQTLVPKYRIRFLGVLNEKVRDAIKRRGEWWRIAPLPRSADEMKRMIEESAIRLGGREIYRYSRVTGTRFLTSAEFAALGRLDGEALRAHLVEIQRHAARSNSHGNPEVELFAAEGRFRKSQLARYDFGGMPEAELRAVHENLSRAFSGAVPAELRADDPESPLWRSRLAAVLIGQPEGTVCDETLIGLSPEFSMQIEWLPAGRIEDGELIFDPVTDVAEDLQDAERERLVDETPRKLMYNFVREHGDLEYVNVGRVVGSLSRRPSSEGRRGVYIAVFKQRESPRELVRVIRLQKRGVRELLEEGTSLLGAMMGSQEYTEYVLDRRLGCRQLGMNLPTRVSAGQLSELYVPASGEPFSIRTPYFERDYIRGIATDKVSLTRFADGEFALRFARLLGRAAASNLVVGRCGRNGESLFDDGDEVLVEDELGMPADIVVADHTGTFTDCTTALTDHAAFYAGPVRKRKAAVPDLTAFAASYVAGFSERFRRIQEDYRRRKRAFDTLFSRRQGDAGDYPERWQMVLARLDATDAGKLAGLLTSCCEG